MTKQRVAVVTGGASGIGYAIANRLASDGAPVAIFDVNGAAAESAANDIAAATASTVRGYAVDVSGRTQVDAAVRQVRADLGPVAILVNNAGIELFCPFAELTEDQFRRILEVNLLGTFHCTQSVLDDMVTAGWGRIVNISSSSAQRGARNMTAYSSSKGAVIALTRSLALELGPHGITVNNVPPGFIETPMLHKSIAEGRLGPNGLEMQIKNTPVGRAGQPEDIAAMVAFLASDEAGYITGQTMGVNGGRIPN